MILIKRFHAAALCMAVMTIAGCKTIENDLTPLMQSVIQQDRAAVASLAIESGDLDQVDKHGNTALLLAAGEYSTSKDESSEDAMAIASILLKNGANPNIENINGGTPIILAIYRGKPQLVELLLSHGADPNRTNKNGWTPLMYTATHCHPEIAVALLKHGADPTIKSTHGKKSALEIAIEDECAPVIELLKPYLEQYDTTTFGIMSRVLAAILSPILSGLKVA